MGRGGITGVCYRRKLAPHRPATQPTHHDGTAASLGHSPRILDKRLEREPFAAQLIYGPEMTRCRMVRQVNHKAVRRCGLDDAVLVGLVEHPDVTRYFDGSVLDVQSI